MKKQKLLYASISLILFAILIWGVFLLKCEILTSMHAKEFNGRAVVALLGDEQNCKVIEYSENKAKVYYVAIEKNMGNLVTFIKEDGGWRIENWNTIWSKHGSADDIIWPYWWHFIYSH